MNIILLFKEELSLSHEENTVKLTGARHQHILQVHRASVGDTVRVALYGGSLGIGKILKLDSSYTEIQVSLNNPAPLPLPLTVILALPRPKVFARIIRDLTTIGIKDIHIINTWRVEKSYWHSPKIKESALHSYIIEGLQQGCDAIPPEITFHRFFSMFISDFLPGLTFNSTPFIAHPGIPQREKAKSETATGSAAKSVVAIGPEGGFIEDEVRAFRERGFHALFLGERILRVETAIPFAISKIISQSN